MTNHQQELLRRLFDLRDPHALRLDLPPHNVIPNPDLMQLSRRELEPEKLQFARRMRAQDQRRIVEELNREMEK